MDVLSFLHKIIVYRHFFHIYNMASKMATNGHVNILIIIGSNQSYIYSQHSAKVSHNKLKGSGDTLC